MSYNPGGWTSTKVKVYAALTAAVLLARLLYVAFN